MKNDEKKVATKSEDELTWQVHPLKENIGTSRIVIEVVTLICLIVYFAFNEFFWVVLSFIFLFVSLSSFFFPTTFFMNDKEIKVKRIFTTITRSWSVFRGYYWDNNGVQLTPFTYPSRLDTYRGLFLRFRNNREEVIDYIKNHLSQVNQKKSENLEKNDE